MKKNDVNKNIDLEEERYGLFMNDDSYDLEMMYGRNYLQSDVNYIVKIHKINIIETKTHDLYGQAKSKDKKFMPPVRVNAMVSIKDGSQDNYGGHENGLTREDSGNIEVNVYLDELEELNLDVVRGDVIEYNLSGEQPRYYEVENAHNVVDTTSQTIAGFKSYWRKITGVPVKEDFTNLLSENRIK